MRSTLTPLLVLALSLAACGGREQPAAPSGGAGADHGHEHEHDDHGAPVALGRVTLGDVTLQVERLGPLLEGVEGAVGARVVEAPPGTRAEALAMFLWAEDDAEHQLSAPSEKFMEDGHPHFHVTVRKGRGVPTRLVLRRTDGGADVRATVALDADATKAWHPAHDGVVAPLRGKTGEILGYVELKLHDDKGDLELWLGEDPSMAKPIDLPLDAAPTVTFPERSGKVVTLRVRNAEQNEDEEGTPSVRAGKTNYFVFPGETGADAAWLMGKEFAAKVVVAFSRDGTDLSTEPFELHPHTHAEGEEHR
jgi:hypothetical protein